MYHVELIVEKEKMHRQLQDNHSTRTACTVEAVIRVHGAAGAYGAVGAVTGALGSPVSRLTPHLNDSIFTQSVLTFYTLKKESLNE